jgi:hypothetical protein
MTLATHAVVGGAVASLFPSHPLIAFFAGFFSHFILDAIPHWDYKILSAYADKKIAKLSEKTKIDKYFVLDLLRTGTDALLGVSVTLLVWHPATIAEWEILALGMIGGMLPDFLQFVYARFPHQPMILIQKFHDFMQTAYRYTFAGYICRFCNFISEISNSVLKVFFIVVAEPNE